MADFETFEIRQVLTNDMPQVTYEPEIKTAEGSSSGKISFGADRTYMKERTGQFPLHTR